MITPCPPTKKPKHKPRAIEAAAKLYRSSIPPKMFFAAKFYRSSESIPKRPQNDPKTIPKRSQNYPKTIPKQSQKCAAPNLIAPQFCQNDFCRELLSLLDFGSWNLRLPRNSIVPQIGQNKFCRKFLTGGGLIITSSG